MRAKRIVSLVICTIMCFSIIPSQTIFAETAANAGNRRVYLHARGADYQGNEDDSTVYMGDVTEVFFAVDTPNRGDYISETDPRNDSIQAEITAATADIIDEYEAKVATESQKAITALKNQITEWYNSPDGDEKTALENEINSSQYKAFLTKGLSELTAADFDATGVLRVENVLETMQGSNYDDIFYEIYGTAYQYLFTYRYEYEYFYLSKINAAVNEVNGDIAAYNAEILAATTTVDKDALKNALLTKYNKTFTFITANADYSVDIDEDKYRVYIRESIHSERVKSGGKYFVGKDAEEMVRHRDPQYDLNGYTVRIYYDPDFLTPVNSAAPINYNAPGLNSMYTTESKDEEIEGGTEETPLDDGLWVYDMRSLPEANGYASVAATIFANGVYFPNKEDGKNWYNLCSVSFIPKKTGRTQVYIERPGADTQFPLELYAKHDPNVPETDFSPTFELNSENGGYHTIIIEEKPLPNAPIASPASSIRREREEVRLSADSDCTIYYKRSGETAWSIYSYPDQDESTINPIVIDYTQSIICKAVRTKGVPDGAEKPESREMQYDYIIVPDSPYLWESSSTQIISECYKDAGTVSFKVYPSDSNAVYKGDIDADRVIYYTFNERLTAADVPDGTDISAELGRDPETQWVRLINNNPEIDIDENVMLRMIARKNDTYSSRPMYSDISEFWLGIRPYGAYDPSYVSGNTYTNSHSVSLTTDNAYETEIYYTLNGTDPISEGVLYSKPIMLTKDTEIKTVAKISGMNIYSDINSFEYAFSAIASDLVEAFYPSGTYEGAVNVTLSNQTPSDAIEYFVKTGDFDGTFTPEDSDFAVYDNEKILIDRNATVYARNVSSGTAGEIYSFEYKIKPFEPVFIPESRQFINVGTVDICTANEDVLATATSEAIEYTLYYSVNGGAWQTADDGFDSVNIPIGNYTEIKAYVEADYGEKSNVITHTYDVVENKPEEPIVTLETGHYILKNGVTEPLTTGFVETPDGTDVYYSVSYNGEPISAPYPDEVGSIPYDKNNPIPIDIKGTTVIKAVAIDSSGVRSDIGTFTYTVTPEAPTAAPSNTINGLTVIPVTAVPSAKVSYTITGEDGVPYNIELIAPSTSGVFYINPADGLPYADEACTTPILYEGTGNAFSGSITLDLKAEIDGVISDTNSYTYTVDTLNTDIISPYADKISGMYEEIKQDAENHVLIVKLYSQNTDSATVIEWRLANELADPTDIDAGWQTYDANEGIKLKKYTLLQARAKLGTNVSEAVSYVYNFRPLPPEIVIPAGVYEEVNGNNILYDLRRPDKEDATATYEGAFDYTIKWRYRHGSIETPYDDYTRSSFNISEPTYVMAYVLNKTTGEISDITDAYYIIRENDLNSYVKVRAPYNVSNIKASLLTTTSYVNGINLDLLIGNFSTHYIEYKYSYKLRNDAQVYSTSWNRYDPNMPILVNSSMEYIIIDAKVFRNDGVEFSPYTHRIDFEYDITEGDIIISGGTSGGGRPIVQTVDKTRKYTKDIFGNEHPTHIGYINGYPDGSVKPDGKITREEVAAILYRIKNKSYDEPFVVTGDVFPDVLLGRWSVKEIEYMTADSVITGYPDGEFKPERNLSRAEFAALVCRFAKLENNSYQNPFSDLSATHWAYKEILALCSAGLINGYEDGTYRPENEITRAEVMTVINKLLGRNPSDSYVRSLGLNPFNDLDRDKWYFVIVLEATVTHNYYLDEQAVEIQWEDYK